MRKLRISLPFIALMVLLCPLFSIAQQPMDTAAIRQLVYKYASRLHISSSDAGNALITSTYFEKETGLQYVYLQQSYRQVSVFNSILSLSFRNNLLVYASGRFVDSIDAKAGSPVPSIAVSQALAKAAEHLQLKAPDRLQPLANRMDTHERKMIFSSAGIAKRDIEATLLWVTADEGATLRLAWNLNIDVLGSDDWWNVRVDAASGAVIDKNNWTIYEMAPPAANKLSAAVPGPFPARPARLQTPPNVTGATYNIVPFPIESPNHGSIAVDNSPWLKTIGYNANAVSEGWHFDGAVNYTTTRGNNVFAYLDYDATNTVNATTNFPDTSATPAPTLSFSNTPDFTLRPFTGINRKFALDNLFYWNNLMHDVSYQYGFTEPAGNFQNDNLGRGGMGNDFVNAQAQDGAGVNNANFTTPGDGTNGMMRMYQFPKPLVCTVNAPAGLAGGFASIEGLLSANNLLMNIGSVTGQLVYYNDDLAGTTHLACSPPVSSLTGFIALINNGGCGGSFTQKIKNAQNAGAIAVIVANSSGGPVVMTGSDNTISIPAVMISQADGVNLAAQLSNNVSVTLSRGVGYDGDVDNGVICHEYTHGISTRLTGGPASASCLINAEQGGEGWSDYMALMMTTNWAAATLTDGANARPIGTYVMGQPTNGPGIRRHPYSTNMAIDPITYADMAASGEVHNIGEIWCSTLWDMTWNIIQQTGSITNVIYNSSGTGGNTIALQLVITGMKLQTCTPGFIDARNAILAADSILYNSAHKCAIWKAFARRGMGYSALQGSNNSTFDQTAAFDLPSGAVLTKTVNPLQLVAGSQVTITHTATCNCQSPLNNYTITDTIPAGFTYISSTGGSVNGNVVTFSPVNFATAQEAHTVSVTLRAGTTGCTVDSSINDNRDGAVAGGLSSAIISGAAGWAPSTLYAHSGTHSWHGCDPGGLSNTTLTSAPFTAGALSILSFWHYFSIEGSYDGGVVELSTDGSSWTDAEPYIVEYPYTTKMDISSILNGRSAYSGGNGGFRRTTINLSSFAGQTLRMRFRISSDVSAGADGWFIDDILLTNGCGGILKSGLMNASALIVDTAIVPVFVLPASSLPLTLLQFNARQAGRQVLLAWQTGRELNTKEFEVQRSGDGLNGWTSIGTVAAQSQGDGDYLLYDNNPLPDLNYYRIKMVDKDLQYTFSPVRAIRMSDSRGFVIIPNPAADQATVHFNQVMYSPEILVADANGRTVVHTTLAGSAGYYTLPVALLSPGVYTITVRSGSAAFTGKLVVAH